MIYEKYIAKTIKHLAIKQVEPFEEMENVWSFYAIEIYIQGLLNEDTPNMWTFYIVQQNGGSSKLTINYFKKRESLYILKIGSANLLI